MAASDLLSRRQALSALLAPTAMAASSVTLAAVEAAPALPPAHPDQALLEAEQAFLAARAARDEAEHRSDEAHEALHALIGPCPEELEPSASDRRRADRIARADRNRRVIFAWARGRDAEDGEVVMMNRCTAKLLRSSIAGAPGALGRAGTTPHVIRRWRGLIPIAEAYEAKADAGEALFRTKELSAASWDARERVTAAEARIIELPAHTASGVR